MGFWWVWSVFIVSIWWAFYAKDYFKVWEAVKA